MQRPWRNLLATGLVALLAGLGGAWLGDRLFAAPEASHSIHARLHHEFNLSPDQKRRLAVIEDDFARRRTSLESEMKAANRELATAMSRDKAYTPAVQAAVDHFHHAMGELQKSTVEHVFAMRAILTPDQQQRFDTLVQDALMKSADGDVR